MNFQEAEQRFHELENRWATGKFPVEAYRAALANLRVTDAAGRVWMIQEHSGCWFVYQNGRWEQQTPPVTRQTRPAAAPASQPVRSVAARQVQAPPAPKSRKGGWSVLLIIGLLSVCVLCGAVGAAGYLVYNGQLTLPESISKLIPEISQSPGAVEPGEPELPPAEIETKQVETITAIPDGSAHADSRGVSLVVPAEALEEGGQVNLQASQLEATWMKDVEKAVSIDTPFYSLEAAGKNDTTGSLSLSFPASNSESRLLAVIDNEYLVELAQVPQNGKLTLQTRARPEDASDFSQPEGYDGTGSIYYAVVTPKSASRKLSDNQMVAYRHVQADERNCIPDISIIGGAAINLCRQNEAGTLQVMLPTIKRELVPQVDLMIDKIEAVMNKYYSLGFASAQLSHSSPMLVRVSTKVTSPSYYPLNGVLYIPVDSVERIATLTPTDVYHEMAHWIQAVKYSTRLAYYSGERTWWLETSAENMVMLVEPSYVGDNLKTYGQITAESGSTLALQDEPYQWPSDYYVHAQLVKINLCDSSACPLSPASFAKAISEGTYPLMNGGMKSQVSSNLKDYAFYLLGKTPSAANASIPLTGPVKTGEGYGEYVRIARTTNTDLKYDYNGSDPQMRKETKEGIETLVVEASLKRDGVYPLMVLGGAGKNPGLPVEMIIEPGASFYYTLDDGELKYSDGSQELKLLPIHGDMGIKKVRLVAMGNQGGEVFKARIQPLSLEGAWAVAPSNEKTGGGMTCSGGDGIEDPDGTALLMAYMLQIISGTGDMQMDSSGRNLDWVEVASRVPASFEGEAYSFQATTLLAGEALKYQAFIDIPKAESSSSLPPAIPLAAAGVFLPVLWYGRKKLDVRTMRVMANVVMIAFLVLVSTGCFGMGMYGSASLDVSFTKIEYVGGEDTGVLTMSSEGMAVPTGTPLWKLTGTGTYQVNFTFETTVTDQDGNDTTETEVCTGSVTYPVTGYVYKDFTIVVPED